MKQVKSKIQFIGAAVLMLSFGCGEPEDKAETTEEDPTGFVNSGGVVVGNTKSFSMIGSWVLEDCTDDAAAALQGPGEGEGDNGGDNGGDNDQGGKDYSKELFNFKSDGTAEVRMTQFTDVGCVTPMLDMNIKADYLIGAEVSATPPVKELNITITAGTFTVLSQEAVDMLNGVGNALTQGSGEGEGEGNGDGEGNGGGEGNGDGEGGGGGGGFPCTKSTPWVLNEAVSLTDMECSSDFPQVGQTMYEIVSVAGDLMMMSKDGVDDGKTGDTAATRNTAIETDAAKAYKKQAVAE